MREIVRIGTRGSKLALFQANQVKSELEKEFNHLHFQIVVIKTKGDKILDVPLSKIGDKGLFTKELETSLFDNEIDVAVHSLKDMPTELPDGLQIGAVLKRAEVRDCLVSDRPVTIHELPDNTVIGTSSLRRKAQLLRINPNFRFVELRGNVNTRIRKMKESACSAMVMASAGLQRLGLDDNISEVIDFETIIPACAQGAIAIETRTDDNFITDLVSKINHIPTFIATNAERAFLRTLEGGCQIPIGSFSQINGNQFSITGFISSIDGKNFIKDSIEGDLKDATELSVRLAKRIFENKGKEILATLRNLDNKISFQSAQLSNKVIISTRPVLNHDKLKEILQKMGATVLDLPMIEIVPAELNAPDKKLLTGPMDYDWLFFTSQNGVKNFFKHQIEINGNTELPSSVKIAVIGRNTAEELDYYGYKPDFLNNGSTSEDFWNEFQKKIHPVNLKFLLAFGNLSDDFFEKKLSKKNKVFRVNVYNTQGIQKVNKETLEILYKDAYDLLLFTSPSTFENFNKFYDFSKNDQLKIGSIGKVTTKAIKNISNIQPLFTAEKPDSEGFIEAINNFFKN